MTARLTERTAMRGRGIWHRVTLVDFSREAMFGANQSGVL
jgi:hypothetical protein